jgi:hypothetical protein
MQVYRVQPVGLELGNHRSETSNENLDCGVHVFYGLEELQGAVNGWCKQDYVPEIVTIACEAKDVRENGDYEGSVLVANRGAIVARKAFQSWDAFAEACRDYAITE